MKVLKEGFIKGFTKSFIAEAEGNNYHPAMDQKALIEKLKVKAVNDIEFPKSIHEYGIANEKFRIELTEIAAANLVSFHASPCIPYPSYKSVFACIQNFQITDQKALIKIAKIRAAKSGWEVYYHIRNYGITNQKGLVEIAKAQIEAEKKRRER